MIVCTTYNFRQYYERDNSYFLHPRRAVCTTIGATLALYIVATHTMFFLEYTSSLSQNYVDS